MTPQEAVAYIESYQWSATRLGLDRTRELLARLGDPQKGLRFVHVAGSNGKGSTCAMVESILRAAGYRTGLYTSPHLLDFCERIQVNGQPIRPTQLAAATEQVKRQADAMEDHPSQFELATAIAMVCFAAAGCDPVVLEVGMGGALDATNVIECPLVAVITNIGLDHTEYLGDTLEQIAANKGGIIKPGRPVVCYPSDPRALATLQAMARAAGAPCCCVAANDAVCLQSGLTGQTFFWQGRTYPLALAGAHQVRNAAVALATIEQLRRQGFHVTHEQEAEGLRTVRWPARMEVLRQKPLFLLDGGHNPQCAQALADALATALPGQTVTILLGVLADKDYPRMLDLLVPFGHRFVCITPPNDRALAATALQAALADRGCDARAYETLTDAVDDVLADPGPVVAFGSLYTAGLVRQQVLARLQQTDPA